MAALMKPRMSCMRSLKMVPRLQSVVGRASASQFSTATRQSNQLAPAAAPSRPCIISRDQPLRVVSQSQAAIRRASTTSQPAASTPAGAAADDTLTWDRFFALRRRRRQINLGSSVLTATAAAAVFLPVALQQDLDGLAMRITGIADPMMMMGLLGVTLAGAGWLCGPSFGGGAFRLWAGRKGWAAGIAEKEKSFYTRIKRYRADPSSSSVQNPLPDYYGEKVSSVKDYRRWLKDQRAFLRKRNKAII